MTESTSDELTAKFMPGPQGELRSLRAASVQTVADRRHVELDQKSVGRLSQMDAMQQQSWTLAHAAHGRFGEATMQRPTGL
jgi:DnaK suppressor protein